MGQAVIGGEEGGRLGRGVGSRPWRGELPRDFKGDDKDNDDLFAETPPS